MAGPRPLSMTQEDKPFSTLEVDHNTWLENDRKAAPIVVEQDPKNGKIVNYEAPSKQRDPVEEKIVNDDDGGKGIVPTQPLPSENRRILGLRRKTFFILLAVALGITIAAAVGGGVGGASAARKKAQAASDNPSSTTSPTPTTTRASYANTGLAAMQWTDLNGTLYKRLYYQDINDLILESAWDNSTAFDTAWIINNISQAVKPGTPIAAAAGYPHASYNYSLVKNVYYMSPTHQIVEHQAPSNNSQAWEDDNFTGLYTASNSTFLAAYWHQNIANSSEELVVLFQDVDVPKAITQGRYTSNSTTSNNWVAQDFPFSQPDGSTFAMSLVAYRSGAHMELYTVDGSNSLQQHEYTISDTDLDSTQNVALTAQSATNLIVDQRSPLAIVAQDNEPLYTTVTLPECAQDTSLTNLILYTVPDRSSIMLSAWNCSTGFLNHTSEIAPLQKPNTIFLALAAMSDMGTGDANVYIMFDSGQGPQVEEWTVPTRAGDPWVDVRNVTVDFGM